MSELDYKIDYNPNKLLDEVKRFLFIKSDAELSRELLVSPPVLSKIRHRRMPVGPSLLLRLNEISNMPIKELRALMGDTRPRFESIVI